DFSKTVQFVIANEEALEQEKRFVDVDINRSFPGDKDSDQHEERLAAQIIEELEGLKVLDIHSTRSYPEPFVTLKTVDERTLDLVKSAGVEKAVYFPNPSGASNEFLEGIIVETGLQQTEQAAENAYDIIINFLAAEGVIDRPFRETDPEIYEYYETVEGKGYRFIAENFEKVEKGEVFARKDGEDMVAEEDFYPVLMSTHGYENILGFKARKLEDA
ncbi:MAG: succinylglutamate desuccinylase/aspartoacylase family protein, partial [Candidatus Aenigmatarchaeota archaeon]